MPSEIELLANERNKYQTKLTGEVDTDAMKNLQAMLKREVKNDDLYKLSAIEVYDHDTENIPRFPAIVLEYKGASGPEQKTIGKVRATFRKNIFANVWYYQADISTKNSASDVRAALSRITSIIQRNSDLNGYCRMGVTINSVNPADRPVNGNIVAGGYVDITIPVVYRDRPAGPG